MYLTIVLRSLIHYCRIPSFSAFSQVSMFALSSPSVCLRHAVFFPFISPSFHIHTCIYIYLFYFRFSLPAYMSRPPYLYSHSLFCIRTHTHSSPSPSSSFFVFTFPTLQSSPCLFFIFLDNYSIPLWYSTSLFVFFSSSSCTSLFSSSSISSSSHYFHHSVSGDQTLSSSYHRHSFESYVRNRLLFSYRSWILNLTKHIKLYGDLTFHCVW